MDVDGVECVYGCLEKDSLYILLRDGAMHRGAIAT